MGGAFIASGDQHAQPQDDSAVNAHIDSLFLHAGANLYAMELLELLAT